MTSKRPSLDDLIAVRGVTDHTGAPVDLDLVVSVMGWVAAEFPDLPASRLGPVLDAQIAVARAAADQDGDGR